MGYILVRVNGLAMSIFDIIKSGFLIFIPGDILKAILAYLIGKNLLKIYPRDKSL